MKPTATGRDGALFTELQRGFTKWGIAEEADMP
jgi:hypothetical protein